MKRKEGRGVRQVRKEEGREGGRKLETFKVALY
jgi:hypothetical protein